MYIHRWPERKTESPAGTPRMLSWAQHLPLNGNVTKSLVCTTCIGLTGPQLNAASAVMYSELCPSVHESATVDSYKVMSLGRLL